jgi:hypothetical protein
MSGPVKPGKIAGLGEARRREPPPAPKIVYYSSEAIKCKPRTILEICTIEREYLSPLKSHCFGVPSILISSSSSPSISTDEREIRDIGRPSFEGEWLERPERLGCWSGVRGGCEEVRLRTGENDRDASRLLIVVRPKPGVPLVVGLFGSVSGSDASRLCISTTLNTRDTGRRTLDFLLLQESFVTRL